VIICCERGQHSKDIPYFKTWHKEITRNKWEFSRGEFNSFS
jgi:hypothetical protein